MACVVRYGAYGLVLTVIMFFNTVNGAAQTTISCGESGGVVGQPQVINCSISGSVTQDIYWYRYNATYNENIVLCFKSADDVGSCVAPPALRSRYNVSSHPQPPRNPSFTIISVTAEDLEVFWLCVDSGTFPDRASIHDSSTCSLKQETTTILPTTTTEGVNKTNVSCGEFRGVVGQPQTLTCDVIGAVTNDIYWYRYTETYHEDIIICFKTGGDVGTCETSKPSLYNVSSQPQQPKQQVFTIVSVTQEDLQVSWLCVDSNSFPERASIQTESTCRLDQGTSPDRECSLEGGVAFIGDFVVGVVVFVVMICVINKVLTTLLKIAVFVIFAVASGILGVGSYVACINGISTGGIIGINIGCMLPILIITIIVVKFAC